MWKLNAGVVPRVRRSASPVISSWKCIISSVTVGEAEDNINAFCRNWNAWSALSVAHQSEHHERRDYTAYPFRNNSAQCGLTAPRLVVINRIFNDGPLICDPSALTRLKKSVGSGAYTTVFCVNNGAFKSGWKPHHKLAGAFSGTDRGLR